MDDDVIYLRRTALLQGAATMGMSGQFHCAENLRQIQALLDEIEGETGWNARDGITIIQRLWEHYQNTRDSFDQKGEPQKHRGER